ncbi:uncharacterized protein [Watersipora subatra]|uniref:uncharacterized protein isoform X2 n=1 Tax=Watersipora subatra TaxID=2589382 RepID=UPI00355C0BEA
MSEGRGMVRLLMQTFLLFAVSILWASGQTVRPHILCKDGTVSVKPGSAGLIKHVPETRSEACSLRIRGFLTSDYISIPGINRAQTQNCNLDKKLMINNEHYCIGGIQSVNTTIIRTEHGELNITFWSPETDEFLLQYYSQVVICGEDVQLPEKADAQQLSGVVVSSYSLQNSTLTDKCETNILNLPAHALIQLDLLYTKGSSVRIKVGGNVFNSSDPPGSKILVAASEQITLQQEKPKAHDYPAFVTRFKVLVCGDIDELDHGIILGASQPWLVGSVIKYGCVDQWQIKDSTKIIECKLSETTEQPEWVADSSTQVQCIPEPWCYDSPADIDNAEYRLSGDNLVATYACLEGFTTGHSISESIIQCRSTDPHTQPWTWSSANLVCSRVKCQVPGYYEDMEHGSIIKQDYYVGDELSYKCHHKYRSETLVLCTHQGTWSVAPSCVLTTSSVSTAFVTGICLLVVGLALTIYGGFTLFLKMRKKCTRPDADNPVDVPPRESIQDPSAELNSKINNIESSSEDKSNSHSGLCKSGGNDDKLGFNSGPPHSTKQDNWLCKSELPPYSHDEAVQDPPTEPQMCNFGSVYSLQVDSIEQNSEDNAGPQHPTEQDNNLCKSEPPPYSHDAIGYKKHQATRNQSYNRTDDQDKKSGIHLNL